MIKDIRLIPGYLEITEDGDQKHQIAITDVLRAADIPNLNIDSLTLLTNLAQVVMVLTKTLVEQGTLDEELISGFDLQYVLETLVDDLEAEEI